ncbi:UvrD-helicase domain-containing protein [Pseudocolwellia sp. HL-MZ7]|uniref:UvrD-helicase domain-containing protein n=1 Tax=Pseudocolwellia sp. HL-MZ7 TaxID=3400627 RepID=UPI003CFB6E1B
MINTIDDQSVPNSKQTSTVTANNLVAHTIPLQGKHLIEASAGTGKTFNITRIYLRLLLEKNLTVEQILVMTFTKDATEELRGRIDAFIRDALNNWDTLSVEDEYFIAIAQHVNADDAKIRLKQALLYLDEASIFTIHGFCKRVLTQHAFTSGQSFNLAMESDCNDVLLESTQDWYRVLARVSPSEFLLISEFWATPHAFVNQFAKAIGRNNSLDLIDEASVINNFVDLVKQSIASIENNHAQLVTYLVDVKKGKDRELRELELQQLVDWLTLLENLLRTDLPSALELANGKMADAFIDGKRYSRSQYKAELLEIFEPVKEVKTLAKKLSKSINRARALTIVREGIYNIRKDVNDKKLSRDLVSFDDLITRLANQLIVTGYDKGADLKELNEPSELSGDISDDLLISSESQKDNLLAELLFKQFPVALVDEFQDTDPQQFTILQAIYYQQPTAALYMIGDPKQAIYGFRGGDVFAYLAARSGCDYQWIMDTNWRSSEAMIQGYNRLFYGNKLSEPARDVFKYSIDYSPVKASPKAKEKQLADASYNALQFIHFTPEKSRGSVPQSFRPTMAKWCANEIVRLLSLSASHNTYTTIRPQNIAILVRDGAEARVIKEALDNAGLASVFMSNRSNLLKSEQTKQLVQVLKGILFVENDRYFSAALASDLLGFNANKLYVLQHDELAWQNLKLAFLSLKQEWESKGFIGMALKLMHEHFIGFSQDKDRVLTNLLHLFELLQSASQRHKQPQELLYWFEQQAQQDNPDIEAELRLESDDDLIRIVTQHGAKGLEYPIVFVPFSTRFKDPLKFGAKAVTFIEYHDDQGNLALSLDGTDKAKQAMADEAYAEAVRLLYVAVTRAEQRCYLLTVEFDKCENSPLGQTLQWQKDTDVQQSLQQLVNDNPNDIGLTLIDDNEDVADCYLADSSNAANIETLSAEKFSGKIERDWWLSSFTALSRNLKHKGISRPDRDNELDEQDNLLLSSVLSNLVNSDTEQAADFNQSSQLRFVIEKGAHTGNLLHNIFEKLEFDQPNWPEAFEWPLSKYGELPAGYSELDLQHWFEQVLAAPLTSSVPSLVAQEVEGIESAENIEKASSLNDVEQQFSLQDLSKDRCIVESEFYFPMNASNTSDLTSLLTQHRKEQMISPENSMLNAQLIAQIQEVQLPHYHKLKGMMHGFIDLIFEQDGKFYVCDYKSTFLGEDFSFYTKEAMRADIEHNHYDLQYLIYSLALHRYLSFALPDYDPQTHFGGIYYLYLRGVTNDLAYSGAGVYQRSITVSELESLDSIFTGVSDE